MANAKQKDILTRLADAGEGALSRMTSSQATARVVESVGGLRERMDDLQKKVRGLDELEKRVVKLEKQVAALGKPKTTRARTTAKAPARKSTSSRSTARKKASS
jgi:hypothetical protein